MVEVREEYSGRLVPEQSRLKLSSLFKPSFWHHLQEHNNKE